MGAAVCEVGREGVGVVDEAGVFVWVRVGAVEVSRKAVSESAREGEGEGATAGAEVVMGAK